MMHTPFGIVNTATVAGLALAGAGSASADIEFCEPLGVETSPDLTVPATGPDGATVRYVAVYYDEEYDGDQTFTCETDAGTSVPVGLDAMFTFPIGTTTVTCTVTDPDDIDEPDGTSSATGSFAVTVEGADAQLTDLSSSVEGVAPGGSLAGKLADAQAERAAGDTAGACSTLAAFVHEAEAQGHILTTEQAEDLIADTERIEAVIGC